MKKLSMAMLVMGLAVLVPSGASAWCINFENGVDGDPVSDIPGISFQDIDGNDSWYADSRTNLYATYSDDLDMGWNADFPPQYHHNGYFWLWAAPDDPAIGVIVDFDNNDGTFFSTGYSSANRFYVVAYLTDGSMVSVDGPPNGGDPMGRLRVDAPAGKFIDYVKLHDHGDFWLIDDLTGDATGVAPVPEPASVALLGLGLAAFGVVRSRRRPGRMGGSGRISKEK